MTIAVHISHTNEQDPVNFTAAFSKLVKLHTNYKFIFFIEKNKQPFVQQTNSRFINISPSIKNNLLLHYWYNYKLPGLLEKNNVDLFINDSAVVSLRTMVRQSMLVKDIRNMEYLISRDKGSKYAKKFFNKFVSKAEIICTPSDYLSEILQNKFPGNVDKIQPIYYGLSTHYIPLALDHQQQIQDKYAGGCSYFFFEVTDNTSAALLPLLKAFSQFKKLQKSSFKLLLLYKGTIAEEPVKDFKNYKHKHDVIIQSYNLVTEAAEIMGASYAVIFLPKNYSPGFSGFHALKAGIPLITSEHDFCKKLYADSALYCHITMEEINIKMMEVYKDETGNNLRIEKGIQLTEKYTWQNTATLLWDALLPQ